MIVVALCEEVVLVVVVVVNPALPYWNVVEFDTGWLVMLAAYTAFTV